MVLLCICSRQNPASTQDLPCVWTLAVVFFIAVKKWKQPRCPSGGEWIDKTCLCPYGGILFSNKKAPSHSWDVGKPETRRACLVGGGHRNCLVCCTSLFLWSVQSRHGFRQTVAPGEAGGSGERLSVSRREWKCSAVARRCGLYNFVNSLTVTELYLKRLNFTSCNLCLKMVKNELNFKYSFYAYWKFIWFFPFMLLVLQI